MKYIVYIGFFCLILCQIFFFCLQKRCDKVYHFRIEIIDTIKDVQLDKIKNEKSIDSCLNQLINKYSFEEMLYSTKPLSLEYWYTQEEVKKIKGDSI